MSDKPDPNAPSTADESAPDLYLIFTKPVSDMTDEELMTSLEQLRKVRKVKLSAGKPKSILDMVLSKLTADEARVILQKMDSLSTSTKKMPATKLEDQQS